MRIEKLIAPEIVNFLQLFRAKNPKYFSKENMSFFGSKGFTHYFKHPKDENTFYTIEKFYSDFGSLGIEGKKTFFKIAEHIFLRDDDGTDNYSYESKITSENSFASGREAMKDFKNYLEIKGLSL